MKEALDFIRAYPSFALACHINPEGDAIGSLLAMQSLLLSLGKSAQAYSQDPIPLFCRFLPGAEQILHEIKLLNPAPAIIVLDCGELQRTGKDFTALATGRPLLNLDHHQTNNYFGTANWVDPSASSTGEMVALLAQACQIKISPEFATCVYTSLLTDTGGFQFANTTAQALSLASQMVAAGADPAAIAEHYYHAKPAAHLRLLALCLPTLEFNSSGSRGELTLTLEMFAQAGTGPEASEGIINFLTDVDSVKVAILFRELKPGEWKVSLRSRGDLDVAKIAERFQGGGHKNAAGLRLEGSLAQVKETIRRAVSGLV